MDNVGSLRYSGRLFHTIGPPDAVKERLPYVESLTGGTTSLLLSEDLRQWRDDLVDAVDDRLLERRTKINKIATQKRVALTVVSTGKLELSPEHGQWLQRRDGQR